MIPCEQIGLHGQVSRIGPLPVTPYTVPPDEAKMMRATFALEQSSKRRMVPIKLVSASNSDIPGADAGFVVVA
jgi:hypothetical protein